MFFTLIATLLTGAFAQADCLKLNTDGLKTVVHKNVTYYTDPENTYLLSSGCTKADASAAEIKLSLKKSGTIEAISEDRVAHTVQAKGATALTVFDFGAHNGQVTAVSGKKSPAELKKIILSKIR